jgi:hypothetical protein
MDMASNGSPPRLNNLMTSSRYDQNMAQNSQRDGFSFGGGISPSMGGGLLRNSLNISRNYQTGGGSLNRSLKPQGSSSFHRLDFYGRKLADGNLDENFNSTGG